MRVTNLSNKDAYAIMYKDTSHISFNHSLIRKGGGSWIIQDVPHANPYTCIVCALKVWDTEFHKPSARLLVLHDHGKAGKVDPDPVESITIHRKNFTAMHHVGKRSESVEWEEELALKAWPVKQPKSECEDLFFVNLNLFLKEKAQNEAAHWKRVEIAYYGESLLRGRCGNSVSKTKGKEFEMRKGETKPVVIPRQLNIACVCEVSFDADEGVRVEKKFVIYAPLEPFVGEVHNIRIDSHALYYKFASSDGYKSAEEMELVWKEQPTGVYPPFSLLKTEAAKTLLTDTFHAQEEQHQTIPPSSSSAQKKKDKTQITNSPSSSSVQKQKKKQIPISSSSSSSSSSQPELHYSTAVLGPTLLDCRKQLQNAESLEFDIMKLLNNLKGWNVEKVKEIQEKEVYFNQTIQKLTKEVEDKNESIQNGKQASVEEVKQLQKKIEKLEHEETTVLRKARGLVINRKEEEKDKREASLIAQNYHSMAALLDYNLSACRGHLHNAESLQFEIMKHLNELEGRNVAGLNEEVNRINQKLVQLNNEMKKLTEAVKEMDKRMQLGDQSREGKNQVSEEQKRLMEEVKQLLGWVEEVEYVESDVLKKVRERVLERKASLTTLLKGSKDMLPQPIARSHSSGSSTTSNDQLQEFDAFNYPHQLFQHVSGAGSSSFTSSGNHLRVPVPRRVRPLSDSFLPQNLEYGQSQYHHRSQSEGHSSLFSKNLSDSQP